MPIRSYPTLALALALFLGQWLAFAHGLQHPASLDDSDCSICVHVHQLGSGAPAAVRALADFTHLSHEAPLALSPLAVALAPQRDYPIRGPPGFKA